MSHKTATLRELSTHGRYHQVFSLNQTPVTDYIYVVTNDDDVLQIGKSSPSKKGRLKKVFKGEIPQKHNKAFICGIFPVLSGIDNEYFALPLSTDQNKKTVEAQIHTALGINTDNDAATLIDTLGITGIVDIHLELWDRFKRNQIYIGLDQQEKEMALELLELVTYAKSQITRTSGTVVPSTQGDNLEGNILKCLDKRYLTTIWLKMCNSYFRYGNAHAISQQEFDNKKKIYSYQARGVPFEVLGHSR